MARRIAFVALGLAAGCGASMVPDDGPTPALDATTPADVAAAHDAAGCVLSAAIAQIHAGGAAVAGFAADTDFEGGTAYDSGDPVRVTGVVDAAPANVYSTYRYGVTAAFTYRFTGLVPGSLQQVRLHFAETYHTAAAQRLFDVAINGQTVLASFDVFVQAGGADLALVRNFFARPDAAGVVTVSFAPIAGHDSAMVSGLELRPASEACAPAVDGGAPPADAGADVITVVADSAPTDAPTGSGPCGTGAGLSATSIGGGAMPAASIPAPTVTVHPGDNVDSVVQAQPVNAVIGFAPGTYANVTIHPRQGQTLVGLGAGVVLDGSLSTAVAVEGGVDDVRVLNLTIQHYTNGTPAGWGLIPGRFGCPTGGCTLPGTPINPHYDIPIPNNAYAATTDHGWTIDYCTLQYNRTAGVGLADGFTVAHSRLLANGVQGYIGEGGNQVITETEIAYNNTPVAFANTGNIASDSFNSGGGGKLTNGRTSEVSHCEVHHNDGVGIWWDVSCAAGVATCNSVHDQSVNGIMWEISRDVRITDNVIARAGRSFDTPDGTVRGISGGSMFDQGAGIYYSSSGDATVQSVIARNTISDSNNGIIVVNSRSTGAGTHTGIEPHNVRVGGAGNGNTLTDTHRNGLVLVDTVTNVLFDDDTYVSCGVWTRGGFNDGTFAQFQAYGQEPHGTAR